MSGYKVWASEDVLTAADLNTFLMQQAIPRFASATTRAGAILSPSEGQLTYRNDGNVYELWNGSAWVALGSFVGTVPNASYATNAGTAVYATTAGNANKVSNKTIFIQSGTPTATATNDLWFW